MGYIFVFLAGLLVGFLLAKWQRKEPFQEYTRVWIQNGPNHAIILYSLDPDRLAALAERMNRRPDSFRFAALVGPRKLLSRSEWVRVRKELLDRELMQQARNRTMTPTPLGKEFFKTYTTTRAHMRKGKSKYTFVRYYHLV